MAAERFIVILNNFIKTGFVAMVTGRICVGCDLFRFNYMHVAKF
jgi:hypothetical protein